MDDDSSTFSSGDMCRRTFSVGELVNHSLFDDLKTEALEN